MMKIAVDAMGGDFGCKTTVEGAILAVKKFKDIEIVLYGDEEQIKPHLTDSTRISVVHTDSAVDMGEKDPVKQIRNNRKSSLVLSMRSAKEGETDAVVTAGPTQAVIVGAHLIIKRLPQMSRVALCPIIPSFDKRGKLMLDVGANVELKPEHLLDLTIFASVAAKEFLNVESPKVGLLNIGTEPGKGREFEKEVARLLTESPRINFYGNVETKEIITNECDILVTDGFTGNMVMKTMEGVAKGMGEILKEEIASSTKGKIGYLFMKKNLKNYKKRLDASEIGGAMIIGINVPVIKAHGNSDGYAFFNAIRQARSLVSNDIINKVTACLPVREEMHE
ncbi:MAG: phosphate acyltransferase PlsX [bacterium]